MHRGPWLVTTTLLIAAACSPALGRPSPAAPIDRYRAAFRDAAGAGITSSIDRDELAARLRSVRVLWLGDVHGSRRVHALQRELLDDLGQRGFRPVLVLEAVGTQDEPAVRLYLDGQLSLAQLGERMHQRWPGSWLDDPELDPPFYRSLLGLARERHLPVLGLEPTPRGPLAARDDSMATRLRSIAAQHAGRLLVVVVGQAHLIGEGDLMRRTDLPSIAIGAEPPAGLRGAAGSDSARGMLLQSDGGIFWFRELLRATD